MDLNLLVIRSHAPSRAASFYECLGLQFQEEKHGCGPTHWAADLDGLILEIYPTQNETDDCTTPRLGFAVENIAPLIENLRKSGVEIISDLRQSTWGLRSVVRNPDGRAVELVQR